MHAQYLVNILDHTGEKIAVLTTWNSLTIEKSINNFSTHTLSVHLDDSVVPLITKDRFIQVMRSDVHEGLNWYQEYIGFHRTPSRQITEAKNKFFTSYGRSMEDLLSRRTNAYRAPHEYTGPADDVMKQIVRENCGPNATLINGRLRNANFTGFEVAANASQAASWHGGRSYRNVLDILKEISLARSVDFKVDFIPPTSTTPIGFRFVTAYPQLGSVKNLLFGPEYGNVNRPQFTASATEEVTVLLVAGSGVEGARQIEIIESIARLETPWNDIELTRDNRNETDVSGMTAVGDSELVKLGEQESFTFELLQTPATLYGRDYNLGDIITVRFGDIVRTFKIVGVNISINRDQGETITCTFGTTEPPTNEKLIRTIANRIQGIEHQGAI